MKKALLLTLLFIASFSTGYAQSKAEKEAAAQARYEKAKAALESKDFVIVPDRYEKKDGTVETNTDDANFLSYEAAEFVYLQGSIVCNNGYTNKATVNSFEQKVDKKGNITVIMQVSGSQITARIEISVRKSSDYAEVIVSPSKGDTKMFSGEVVPRSQAKYYKKSNII
ncbi:MAG: DUF4251 domain-containing protein [Rikenellaceae bacterium]